MDYKKRDEATEIVTLWITKDEKKQLDDLETTAFMDEYIDKSKREISTCYDALDDDLIHYKSKMLKWHEMIKVAYAEQVEKNYSLFESFDSDLSELRSKVKTLSSTFEPIKKEINDLQEMLKPINTWQAEKFVELISKVSNLNSDDKKALG